jgi:hypothetical protein
MVYGPTQVPLDNDISGAFYDRAMVVALVALANAQTGMGIATPAER